MILKTFPTRVAGTDFYPLSHLYLYFHFSFCLNLPVVLLLLQILQPEVTPVHTNIYTTFTTSLSQYYPSPSFQFSHSLTYVHTYVHIYVAIRPTPYHTNQSLHQVARKSFYSSFNLFDQVFRYISACPPSLLLYTSFSLSQKTKDFCFFGVYSTYATARNRHLVKSINQIFSGYAGANATGAWIIGNACSDFDESVWTIVGKFWNLFGGWKDGG